VLGDSNNPNPPTGGLSYGKSQDFGLNLTAMPPAPSPKGEREARLLGFVVIFAFGSLVLFFSINRQIPRILAPFPASVRQSSRRCLAEKGRGRGLISNSLSPSNGIGIALAGFFEMSLSR